MATDYDTEVLKGNVPGVSRIANLGVVTVATPASVPLDINSTPIILPSAGVNLEVVSDNVNDTAAGTGMQAIVMGGVNRDYQVIRPFNVSMNGTTPVPIPTPSVGQFFRINPPRGTMVTPNPAVNQTNIGTITIRVAGGGAILAVIAPGAGVAQQSLFTVPDRCLLLVRSIELQILSSAGGTARGADGVLVFRASNGFTTKARKIGTTDARPYPLEARTWIPVLARTDFWLQCIYTSNNNMQVTASYEAHLHQL